MDGHDVSLPYDEQEKLVLKLGVLCFAVWLVHLALASGLQNLLR